MIDMGVLYKVIEKSGAWYSYGSERIGQGKDNVREYLREHPEMAAEIEAKIRAAAGVRPLLLLRNVLKALGNKPVTPRKFGLVHQWSPKVRCESAIQLSDPTWV